MRRCVRCGGSDSTKKSRRVKVTTTEIFDLLLFTLILGGVIWLGYRTMRLRPPRRREGPALTLEATREKGAVF